MATPVIMPRQGQSVESCIIAKWHKQKGDKVEVGDMWSLRYIVCLILNFYSFIGWKTHVRV